DAAAGFSLPVDKWPDFERMAAEYLSAVDLEEVEETVEIDAELPHEYLAPSLAGLVERMEPFGEGNPALVFMARSVAILQVDIVGKQEKSHLKLLLDFGAHRWPALWWNAAERYGKDFDESDRLDLAFRLQKNYWNGQETPQLVIVDARKAE
ncbi:MAG TPA: single-stranded-DNA-specific exonuclease RecJ, partial [Spirochaetales bacterium]|nr:single-stranded-DNA-specific exonuclease RecJ [Spirochaetales bacterium]